MIKIFVSNIVIVPLYIAMFLISFELAYILHIAGAEYKHNEIFLVIAIGLSFGLVVGRITASSSEFTMREMQSPRGAIFKLKLRR